uniref:Uncharacterized protein n=1 Tax=Spongospora subterranea TaxID=70186 RepID=A0A0H5RT21_9EUKA|eukprot:CRZ11879.1 hypothetical protein [Spongospora subterranea]
MVQSTEVLALAMCVSLISYGTLGQTIPAPNSTEIHTPGGVPFSPGNKSVIPPSEMTACNLTGFVAASLKNQSTANQSLNLFDDNVHIVADDITHDMEVRMTGKKDLALFLKAQIMLTDLFGNTTISLNKTLVDKKNECVVPFTVRSEILSKCQGLQNGALQGILNVHSQNDKIVNFNRSLDASQRRIAGNCMLNKLKSMNRTSLNQTG